MKYWNENVMQWYASLAIQTTATEVEKPLKGD